MTELFTNKQTITGYVLIKKYPNSPAIGYFEPYTTGEYSHYPEYWEPVYKPSEDVKIKFTKELSALINTYGIDNTLNTPDYRLAEWLTNCLTSYTKIYNG